MSPAFTVPTFTLPAVISRIGSFLPQWPHGVPITLALNAIHRFGGFSAEQLAPLEGKRFRITVEDTGTVASFEYRDGRFRPLMHTPSDADLQFSAQLAAYLQLMARQEDPDTLFFNRRLSIEGDTELGLHVKNMFDALDWKAVLPLLRRGH